MENGLNMMYMTLGTFMLVLAVTMLLYVNDIFNSTYDKVVNNTMDSSILVDNRGQ